MPAWTQFALVAFLTLAACAPLVQTAFFCLDDYRYLDAVRQIDAGVEGVWAEATVVENRWDAHWWIPDDTYVRFFRPYMITSYLVDDAIWGADPVGLTATNVLLHLAVTLLVLGCLRQLLGVGWAATIGAVSFGLQYSHFENLYYIPGRASVMATLGMVAALYLHLRTRERPTTATRIGVALLTGVAFFGKESAVILPALIVALDWLAPTGSQPGGLVPALRRNALYLGLAVVLGAAYLWVRTAALGEAGPGTNVHPYIHWPSHPGFAERTWAVWLQYCSGLATGAFIQTFLEIPSQLYERVSGFELAVGALWVHGLLIFGLTDRRGRWLVLLFALSLVPLLPLYASARHAYTATIGYCGLIGLLAHRLLRQPSPLRLAVVGIVVVAFVLLPAARLVAFLRDYPPTQSTPDPAAFMAKMVTEGDMELDPTRPAFLFDFPGDWFKMQFAPATIAVTLGRDLPRLEFLTATKMGGKRPVEIERVDDRTLDLHRRNAPILPFVGGPGGRRDWQPGDVVHRRGYDVEIVECRGERPIRLRVRFEEPLDRLQLGRFERDGAWRLMRVRP